MTDWTLAAIAAATDIPIRRIRYAVFHKLIPGLRSRPAKKLAKYNDLEAFAVGIAASLLQTGFTSKTVQTFMRDVGGIKPQSRLRDWFAEQAIVDVPVGVIAVIRLDCQPLTLPKHP